MRQNNDSSESNLNGNVSHSFTPVGYRPVPCFVRELSEHTICLDGAWRFNPSPTALSPEQSLDTKPWAEITIPGQWAQQGYEIPHDQTVALALDFKVPEDWSGYRVFIRFDAVHGNASYWLNNTLIGQSENLFTPVEFEITDVALPGEANRLYLEMKVESLSEQLAQACAYVMHSLGGISRSVRIFALPKTHFKTIGVLTDLDDEYRDATIDLGVALDVPEYARGCDYKMCVKIIDEQDSEQSIDQSEFDLKPTGEGSRCKLSVANPKKWSAEKPHLYRLVMELVDEDGMVERVEHNIGFRKIEIRDTQVYINGTRVKWAGICRHEVDPFTGRADTMRHAETDVRMIREANYNYIRTSHYPPPKELLDAADRLGAYVEVEAPVCFAFKDYSDEMNSLSELLTPISAMVDYCHIHPSVVVWSLANESDYFPCYDEANELVKTMDPTRITTFNHSMHGTYEHVCDIANFHYVPMPYDELFKDDPRPLFLGEYSFPLCHERTEMEINPGLSELWGMGHSDPNSDWGRECAKSFDAAMLQPGAPPGFWNHIYASDQLVGGAVFAWIDELFFLPGGKRCGHTFEHGSWGMVDVWRRLKPEWWLSKLLFSPVWFPKRRFEIEAGQESVRIPIENRYSFTDLGELSFVWRLSEQSGTANVSVAPGETGVLKIPLASDSARSGSLVVEARDAAGTLVNVLSAQLGEMPPVQLPPLGSGCPTISSDGCKDVIEGDGFRMVFNRVKADFDSEAPQHTSSVAHFPRLHITRQEFRDLAPDKPLYAEFPDESTRVIESVAVEPTGDHLEIAVRDRYEQFSGTMTLALDRSGVARISYDYVFSAMGPTKTLPFRPLDCREIGVKIGLRDACETLSWRRWSEWGVFPEDSICRTQGTAKAWRDSSGDDTHKCETPKWPWRLDQTPLGTRDFRSIKFNIYEASLTSDDGAGLGVYANADRHVRACVTGGLTNMHILRDCRLGPTVLKHLDRIQGDCVVSILSPVSGK